MHLGNVTGYLVIDEKATPEQRVALGRIFGGEMGGPFAALASLLVKVIGPEFVPVEWKFARARQLRALRRSGRGRLKMIENPVTSEKSGFTLQMTTDCSQTKPS
jgi:hypothetical protein